MQLVLGCLAHAVATDDPEIGVAAGGAAREAVESETRKEAW